MDIYVKTCKRASIFLTSFLAALGILGAVFCFGFGLWNKSVSSEITNIQETIDKKDFNSAEKMLAVVSALPSGKINREKILEQKGIIAAHKGEVDVAIEYFRKIESFSEIGEYYNELSQITNYPPERIRSVRAGELRITNFLKNKFSADNRTQLPVINLIDDHNKIIDSQVKSAYRELLLSQILIDLNEPYLAIYALNQGIKKDPDYRDLYVLLMAIEESLGNDVEWIKEKIGEIDPDY